jgi:hypothetical protein
MQLTTREMQLIMRMRCISSDLFIESGLWKPPSFMQQALLSGWLGGGVCGFCRRPLTSGIVVSIVSVKRLTILVAHTCYITMFCPDIE